MATLFQKRSCKMLLPLLFLLLLIGTLPVWPFSKNWGYVPFRLVALSILTLIAILLTLGGGIGLAEIIFILALVGGVIYSFVKWPPHKADNGFIFCTKCGQENSRLQHYCGRCGQPLPDLEAQRLRKLRPKSDQLEQSNFGSANTNSFEGIPSVTERTTQHLRVETTTPERAQETNE